MTEFKEKELEYLLNARDMLWEKDDECKELAETISEFINKKIPEDAW